MVTSQPFAELPVDEEALLARLAHLPAAADVPTAAAASGLSPRLAQELMRSLAGKGLLTAAFGGGVRGTLYTLHPDAADRARALLPSIGPETLGRYLDALIDTAEQASGLLTPNHRLFPHASRHHPLPALRLSTAQDARTWLDATVPDLPAILTAAGDAREDEAAVALVVAVFARFHLTRGGDLWVTVHELGLAAAERLQAPEAVRYMLHTLASGHRERGEHDRAIDYLTRALAVAHESGDEAAVAQHTRGIGACHHAAGRYAEARPYLEEARLRLRQLDRPRDLALTLTLLGSAHTAAGHPGHAVELLEEALPLIRSLPHPDPVNTGRIEAFLGQAHSAADSRALSTLHFSRALEQFADVGAHHWTARTLEFFGLAARRAGDEKAAALWLRASHAMYQALDRPTDTKRLTGLLEGAEGR
ncbi:tetratricopeptide repeat protein [Kitasatospora sp. YST-16]|uniref:tetratricopeptide repeat protein n=1 Tax=Kitasatospora sp. YST-16 TaxID=2998080 RepID=UPI002284555C|nr:tetratricopeptide repeat protein [Kitasatospora sp. YST-16]WAL74525.1 tetratricopeptide repeat protein [Kitasatospora sp. YST-16]WNW40586.1 tetratricopeptide repeat protein [Streptomyces sp. Li-HN-5-13]